MNHRFKSMHLAHLGLALLAALSGPATAAPASPLAQPAAGVRAAEGVAQRPAALAAAHTVAALPGGRWLALDKKQLQWLGPQGQVLGRWAVRAKHMDTRSDGPETVAVLLDADSGRPLLLRLQDGHTPPARLQPLAPADVATETLCLYRDAQRLLHVFLLADDGLSEQWLLPGDASSDEALRVRRLATPTEPHSCRVDDQRQVLYVSEPALGVWAYRAEAEGGAERQLLAALPGAASLQVLPQGVRVQAPAQAGQSATRLLTAPKWPVPSVLPVVLPRVQTPPVARAGDAADDPAIWVHPQDRRLSRVLGTNKKQGLLVYDLAGAERQLLPVGRINNVDLRQGVHTPGQPVRDLAVATHRDEDSLVLFDIAADGTVSELARMPVALKDLYGVCVAQAADRSLQVLANNKAGELVMYRVVHAEGRWQAQVQQRWQFGGQLEGCEVDEAQQIAFVGEERRGVWSINLAAPAGTPPRLVLGVGGVLVPDVEGIALHRSEAGAYLVVSSQGNHSFVVLDAAAPHRVRGAFRIGMNVALRIDGASETDGLAVSAADFGSGPGGDYSLGLLVVQDGHKHLPDGAQNFKYVAWRDVVQALGLGSSPSPGR